MRREDLTPHQRDVVEARNKVLLVKGGPGSGKTTTALWAAREAVTSGEVGADQHVLFLTFSRTAVSQLLAGAPAVMEEAGSQIEVVTFHGLSFRLLRAFGRYAGRGRELPHIQSEASRRLLGGLGANEFSYDDMVPAALTLLRPGRVWNLLRYRWPVVICDEFQDTGDDQMDLVMRLADAARLILLADPNQMIYDFRNDVRPGRIGEAAALAEQIIELEERSHRDPSGAIPALARAVLRRDFGNEAVRHALNTERLRVLTFDDETELADLVRTEVALLRHGGCRTVGVFGFTNEGVSLLSAELSARGVSNVIIGLSEAQAEGVAAMAVLAGHAAGLKDIEQVKVALATFLTATVRAPRVPDAALSLAGRLPMPRGLEGLVGQLSEALRGAAVGTVADVLQIVRQAWRGVFAAGRGSRLWYRASAQFAGLASNLASRPASPEAIGVIIERSGRAYSAGLVQEVQETRTRAVQLMNFHQTKGREADGVVLAFRSDDFYARRTEREPYPARSRLLYVAISRARARVSIILPSDPHPLIAPLIRYTADPPAEVAPEDVPF